jgi:hypothetical protein
MKVPAATAEWNIRDQHLGGGGGGGGSRYKQTHGTHMHTTAHFITLICFARFASTGAQPANGASIFVDMVTGDLNVALPKG